MYNVNILTKYRAYIMQKRNADWGDYKGDLDRDEKLMVAIVKASETYKKNAGTIFRNFGLTFTQYNVLRILTNSPQGKNTITITSRIMLVSGANMTGVAKRLEKDGFIIRRGDTSDERITWLEITPKGKRTIKNIAAEKDRLIQTCLLDLSEKEKKDVLEHVKCIFKQGETYRNST
jgi:MarR family 2-MHQ and catechol resistance regulon transcriptional repressor